MARRLLEKERNEITPTDRTEARIRIHKNAAPERASVPAKSPLPPPVAEDARSLELPEELTAQTYHVLPQVGGWSARKVGKASDACPGDETKRLKQTTSAPIL
jgi:hypothetical protein